MICDRYDIVVVPFPFTDRSTSKRRPALVISTAESFNNSIGQSVLAMITSTANSSWPLDINIKNLDAAGLSSPSTVRMKLFTLDHRLFIRKAGKLSEKDQRLVKLSLKRLMGF